MKFMNKATFITILILLTVSVYFNIQYYQHDKAASRQYELFLNHLYGAAYTSHNVLSDMLSNYGHENINVEQIVRLTQHLDRLDFLLTRATSYIHGLDNLSHVNLFSLSTNFILNSDEFELLAFQSKPLTEKNRAFLFGLKEQIDLIINIMYSEETGQENRELDKQVINNDILRHANHHFFNALIE